VVVIPGNMYGEFDNFHPLDSHVVPAMIRRYYEAMLNKASEVVMWGTGRPERDFVYAGDVARLIPYFIDTYSSDQPVNLSSGTRTAIRELAETIAVLAEYKGKIVWDDSKPDGQMVKIFDTRRMASLGLACGTPLREGISRTMAWFGANYATRGDGLRL
jgi:GDP-L-fucose synthase